MDGEALAWAAIVAGVADPANLFVTGGSGALGAVICRSLAQAGCAVAVAFHEHRAAAEDVVAEIREAGGEAHAIGIDLENPQCADSIGRDIAAMGGVDVLVHAAGRKLDGLAADLDPLELGRLFAVNVTGAFHAVRAALPWLLQSDRGRIILMSSVLAARGAVGVAGYAATKGAIESVTRTLAVELSRRGVLVNAVAPGFVNTRMSVVDGRNELESDWFRDVYVENGKLPIRRYAEPEEIAAPVAWLASDQNTYLTGQVVTVDGGLTVTF